MRRPDDADADADADAGAFVTVPGDGEVVRTFVDGVPVAVWNVGGTLHAVGDVCPHRGWVLSEGPLERGVDGRVRVVCPGHHWRFALDDGECDFSPERLALFRCEPVGPSGGTDGAGDTVPTVRVVPDTPDASDGRPGPTP